MKKVQFEIKYENADDFFTLKDELEISFKAGIITEDNILYQFVMSEDIVSAIKALQPTQPKEKKVNKELIGLTYFGDKMLAICESLDLRIPPGDYRSKDIVASIICNITVSGFKNLSDEDKQKELIPVIAWITANCNNDSEALFLSKKGRSGGITLNKTLTPKNPDLTGVPF